VLLWAPLAGVLAVSILLLGGSFIAPLAHPNALFEVEHPAHNGCRPVQISDGDDLMPGYLLTPHLPQLSLKGKEKTHEAAVCVVPGAGDTKTSFKWRLVQALLAEGLTILTIDPHGHGDYGHRPLVYPDCLAVIPAAVQFLRAQPGISRVGLAGISLGGALAIKALAEQSNLGHRLVEALVVLETPVELNYSDSLFYREFWNTIYRAPVLSLLREITLRQIRESWYSGGYRSRHNTSELFRLLNPLENIGRLKDIPILLVYSRRDLIASASQAQAMQQAAPQATFIESKKASHVTLTLIPEINRQVANWLKAQLGQ
jgi:pimeloyl-ACP methyl ester carboxylesterase